jgi:hypothetical protein
MVIRSHGLTLVQALPLVKPPLRFYGNCSTFEALSNTCANGNGRPGH